MVEQPSLAGLLRATRDRSTVVAYQRGVPRSLGDLEQRVRAWYAAFAGAPGRRYVLHSEDALEFVAALLGAWHAGKRVLVPSDLQLAAVGASGLDIDGHAGGLVAADPYAGSLPGLDAEALQLEMFTSGSTGAPIAIPKCLRQLEQEIAALAATLDLGSPARRVLGTVSHQHMYGLMFRVLLPLATGRPFEALRLSQVQDLSLVEAAAGCILVTSPAQLVRLPQPGSFRCDVTAVLSAGGPLPEEGVQSCHELLHVPVTEIYGSSETGAVAMRMRAPGVCPPWKPLPGVEYRTDSGQLELRTRQLPGSDWFRTADRAATSGDGFELAGRVDRIVKLQEKRVSLDAVENVLLAGGLLSKVRALVLAEPRQMLAVAALPNAAGQILARQGKRQLVDALLATLRQSAQIEVLPRSWRIVDPWPVTVDGKTPDALLRERFDRRNPEFQVLEQDASACLAEVWVSPTAPFFAGHFPGQPVLAGVVQIDWLVWMSRRLFHIEAGFRGLEAAKFRRVIIPGSRLRVSLRNDAAAGRTSYTITHREQACASGRIRWDSGP